MAKIEVNDKVPDDKEAEDNHEAKEDDPLNANESEATITKNDPKKLTFREKLKLIKDNITVEPIQICYNMPSVISSMAVMNLNLEKACRVNLNYSDEICDALTLRQTENYTQYETEVQTLIAGVQAWKNVIQTAIPCCLILFVGAWSDKTGKRKACIMLPIVGEFLASLGFILNTYFFYELPVEVAALTEVIFPAMTGGWIVNFIGIFSYIGDVTTKEERTFRIGIVNLCANLGYPVGNALSGVLVHCIGYYGVFSLTSTLYFFSLMYGFFYLEEPYKRKQFVATGKEVKTCEEPKKNIFVEFFDFRSAMGTFKVAFKKGERNRRLRVCLLLIGVCVVFGPMSGEYPVFYLFTRKRFNWDEIKFSVWCAYWSVTNSLGTIFTITFFTKYLKIDDTLLGIISNSSKIVSSCAYAFARTDVEIYLAPLLELLNGAAFIAMRSTASKLVKSNELGKVNSLFGLAEAAMPLVYGPMYSIFYMKTLEVLPGAVFLLSAALTLPAIAIFWRLYFEEKKFKLQEDHAEKEITIICK